MGKRTAREGAGDLGTASSRKPRRWRRPVPPRAATAAPQPLPAAPPGSGESVGTKWPPLPPQGCSAGTLRRASEQARPSRERGRREDGLSFRSSSSTLGRGEVSEGGPGADELSYIATGKRAAPARATFSPCPLTAVHTADRSREWGNLTAVCGWGGRLVFLDYFALQRNLLHSGENEPCLPSLISSSPLFKGSLALKSLFIPSLSLSLSLPQTLSHITYPGLEGQFMLIFHLPILQVSLSP